VNYFRRVGFWLAWAMPLVSLTNIFSLNLVPGLPIHGVDLLFVGGWGIWLLTLLVSRKVSRVGLPYVVLMSLYVGIVLVGFLLLRDYEMAWPIYFRFVETLLWAGLALTFIQQQHDLDMLVWSLCLAGAILALSSLYFSITVPGLQRIAGFFSAAGGEGLGRQASYNEIGAIHALSVLAMTQWLVARRPSTVRGKQRAMAVVLVVCNMMGLVLTQSRSALLAAGVGFLFVVFRWKAPNRALAWGITIAVLCAALLSMQGVGINRLSDSFSPGLNAYDSIQERFHLWDQSMQLWLDSPGSFFIGYGNAGFRSRLKSSTADIFYLDHGLSEGFIGLAVLLLLLFLPFRAVRRMGGGDKPGNMAFLVAVTVSLTGNVLVDPFYGGITFLLLYGSLAVQYRQQIEGTATARGVL
jgi:hypothetical protein